MPIRSLWHRNLANSTWVRCRGGINIAFAGDSGQSPQRIEVVVGIVRDSAGRVLVNQRRPDTHLAGLWEFPGGKRHAREGRQAALARELHEELGIEVVMAEPLLTLHHDYPDRRVHLDVWSVLEYSGEPRSREDQAIAWVYPEALSSLELLPADAPIVGKLLDDAG
jgi:8-oxo-dGTP diphosphatase